MKAIKALLGGDENRVKLTQTEAEFAQLMDQCEAELQTEREFLKMNVVPLQRHLVWLKIFYFYKFSGNLLQIFKNLLFFVKFKEIYCKF